MSSLLDPKLTFWRGKFALFYFVYVSPIPPIGKEDPSPISTKSDPQYLRILDKKLGLLVMWLEAPMSNLHSISEIVLSKVRIARSWGITVKHQ